MTDPIQPPSANPPPPPPYVPPPIIRRRPPVPQHRPIFDNPPPRESYKTSVGHKIGMVLVCVVGIPIAILAVLAFFGHMVGESAHEKGQFTQYELEQQAHVPFSALSTDPDSNRYRDEQWRGDVFCGEVNVKNRMGGYDGWTPFSLDTSGAHPATATSKAAYGKEHWGWGVVDARCGPMQP